MKVAIYTAVFDNYDCLMPILSKSLRCKYDFIVFSDKPISCYGWKNVIVNVNNRNKNRYIKFHPEKFLQNYDSSLYIDGNIRLKSVSFIDDLLSHDVVFFNHPFRKNVKDEISALKKHLNLSAVEVLDSEYSHICNLYQTIDDDLLFENNMIYRRHEYWDTLKLGSIIIDHINTWSGRDQLVIPYLLRAYAVNFSVFPNISRDKNFVQMYAHHRDQGVRSKIKIFLQAYNLISFR